MNKSNFKIPRILLPKLTSTGNEIAKVFDLSKTTLVYTIDCFPDTDKK